MQDTVTHLQDQLSEATTPTNNGVSPLATPPNAIALDHGKTLPPCNLWCLVVVVGMDAFQIKFEQLIEQHFKKIDESLKNVST